MNLIKHASRFQLVMGLQKGLTTVTLRRSSDLPWFGDEVGVYMPQFRNDFNTPLALRGPREEVEAYLETL